MAPLLDWGEDKLRETALIWHPIGIFKKLFYRARYGKWYNFTTPQYNEYYYHMGEHVDLIKHMRDQGLNFQIREGADKSMERRFIKFIAGDQTDITAMVIMK